MLTCYSCHLCERLSSTKKNCTSCEKGKHQTPLKKIPIVFDYGLKKRGLWYVKNWLEQANFSANPAD